MHIGTRAGSSPCPAARFPAMVSTATIPCAEAACASSSGPTRSPIAYTPSALVRRLASTTTKSFSVRTPASLRPRSSESDARPALAASEALVAVAHEHLDPLTREGARQFAPEVDVHAGEEGLRHLDHGHLRAEGGVEVRELDADRAAADDHGGGREHRPLERLAAGDHDLAVDLEPGERALAAPGGEQHEARADPLAVHGHAAARQPPDALAVRDLVLLEQELDALRLAVGDLARACDHARVVDAHVVGEDAAARGRLQLREERGVGKQRLRR